MMPAILTPKRRGNNAAILRKSSYLWFQDNQFDDSIQGFTGRRYRGVSGTGQPLSSWHDGRVVVHGEKQGETIMPKPASVAPLRQTLVRVGRA
jgi:hypothetical protein